MFLDKNFRKLFNFCYLYEIQLILWLCIILNKLRNEQILRFNGTKIISKYKALISVSWFYLYLLQMVQEASLFKFHIFWTLVPLSQKHFGLQYIWRRDLINSFMVGLALAIFQWNEKHGCFLVNELKQRVFCVYITHNWL